MGHRFDVVVVGAGHAGTEAALAAARLGARTACITLALDQVAAMPCNPAVGGVAKGHLVREIDALGGEMGRATDATTIQFRMLNTSKGSAVRSPRAQTDRVAYSAWMRDALESQPGLTLLEDAVIALDARCGRITAVHTRRHGRLTAGAVVLTGGTFLRGVLHYGTRSGPGGRRGEAPVAELTASLHRLGLTTGRFKTGTPPRILGPTIDTSALQVQPGDPRPGTFSFDGSPSPLPQVACHLTRTTARTHEVVRSGLSRSPLYTGRIRGTGPRYCPSLEDKVVRFPQRESHQVFLEPEGLDRPEIYPAGLSTSLPPDVQEAFVHTIPGLERARILRYGYAVEYDYVPPHQIDATLQARAAAGLFLAGQINGTSGYEEAAAQGLLAGINAARHLTGSDPVVVARHEGYIGVLVDDLVTRGVEEPYRMFTSRAEYRLALRHSSADRRLRPLGHQVGLVNDARMARVQRKEEAIAAARAHLAASRRAGEPLEVRLRRPDVRLSHLAAEDPALAALVQDPEVAEEVEAEVKYSGYLARQERQIARARRAEQQRIPPDLDYDSIPSLRTESRQQLLRYRPASLGQAARLRGVTPADVAVLSVHLARRARQGTGAPGRA